MDKRERKSRLKDIIGMIDEEVYNTLKEYGQWYIMEEE